MKAILISAKSRTVTHHVLRSAIRSARTIFAEPQLVGRLPNGDVIWADTDRIHRKTFRVGNGADVVGAGLIVGKKDEYGDHGAPRTDLESVRALVQFGELAPFEVETTPDAISRPIQRFTSELKSQAPTYLRVAPSLGGKSGRCWENVNNAIRLVGGTKVHGWTIWERGGLFLTAEFHAVWCTPEGELIDVTPKPDREKRILFSADPDRYPAHFNFLQRPGNLRYRLYRVTPDVSAISSLTDARMAYENRQAAKRGLTLEEHLASKVELTDLEAAIERLFAVCLETDELVQVTARGLTSKYPERVARLDAEKMGLHEEILRMARERPSGVNPSLQHPEA